MGKMQEHGWVRILDWVLEGAGVVQSSRAGRLARLESERLDQCGASFSKRFHRECCCIT